MIKKIGVENFRVFKEYTEFEIRPITLLTGPNNSGKSSFTKLLMLLENGLSYLDFNSKQHNLEKFEDILNWEMNDSELKIKIPLEDFMFQGFQVVYTYADSKLSKIGIESDNYNLLEYYFDVPSIQPNRLHFCESEKVNKLKFNIKYYLDLFYDLKSLVTTDNKEIIELENLKVTDKNFYIKDYFNNRDQDEEFFEPGEDILQFFNDTIESSFEALKNELELLEKDYLLFDIYIDDQNVTKENEQLLLDLQFEVFSSLEFFNSSLRKRKSARINIFINQLSEVSNALKEEIELKLQRILKKDKLSVEFNLLSQIVFNSFEEDFGEPLNVILDFTNLFSPDSKFLSNFLFNEEIGYISPNRGSQKRILHNSSENDIDKIIVDYSQLPQKRIPFLEEVFKILGIKGELIVERHENYISKVYLKKEKHKVSLADLGYGYSQIIPIVLKICNISNQQNDNSKVLIIEEPEANLHPALQSKFANILLLALKEFPYFHFIIETHSEYLVRKLQYFTAKKDLNIDNVLIYYFNADEYVSHDEPKVKKIEITETGNLTENFGPGFYDEATRLQFELMKVKKQNKP